MDTVFSIPRLARLALYATATLAMACVPALPLIAQTPASGETIVLIRHGEKPLSGLGQLTCRGLNRSLALPDVLIGRFGHPNAIYAPDPADQIHDNHPGAPPSPLYSYVRPLATIEPTAIQLEMPVNTQIGFDQIGALQRAVTAPEYANSTVFIAWEHGYAEKFGKQMLTSYGLDPSAVPYWSNSDYETIYVFHITPPTAAGAKPKLTFKVEKEGLSASLSDVCPDEQHGQAPPAN